MLNHGLSTGALFLLVGMIYERRHSRLIADFGGLWKQVPIFSASLLAVTFSSIGLPGLNGFVGEFLILLGAFSVTPLWTAAAATGVILGAIYMLWMIRRVIFGPLVHPENQKLTDLNGREIFILAPILALIVLMGVYPQPFLDRMKPSVDLTLKKVFAAQATVVAVHRPAGPSTRPPAMAGGHSLGILPENRGVVLSERSESKGEGSGAPGLPGRLHGADK
jgi:NADH-quinone oxidoreductase subunit M